MAITLQDGESPPTRRRIPRDMVFDVTEDYVVTVNKRTWQRFQRRLERCKRPVGLWMALSSAGLAALVTAAVEGYNRLQNEESLGVYPEAMVGAAVVMLLGGFGAYQSRRQQSASIDDILEEMREIDEREHASSPAGNDAPDED